MTQRPDSEKVQHRGVARALAGVTAALLAVAGVVALGGSADAASSFAPGDLVVYRVGDGTTTLGSSATSVFLDEYTPGGSLVQSIPMPTSASGASAALTASGTATSEGLLTLSSDGRYLMVPGYDAPVGTAKIAGTTSVAVPRTVGRVDAAGNIDTTTALTDASTGNNPRSATSSNGTDIWVGGAAGGPRYTTLGATTSTELDVASAFKNVREVSVVDGQLYASSDPTKNGLLVGTVGTGLPTTPTTNIAALPFDNAPSDPYGYSLLTLGAGSTPDTLYEADFNAGAVVKYGLIGGTWTKEGSVLVSTPAGLTANDNDGTVSIYVTSSGAAGTAGVLSEITDASGVGGVLSGSATTVATLPANEAARGIAFAPGTTIGTGGGVKPPVINPTITTARGGLPAAQRDSSNETLGITVDDANPAITPDELVVTAVSSNTSVATDSDVSITGTGANRTVSVTPEAGVVGKSTITLTVTAPDDTSGTTQFVYGVSADLTPSLTSASSDLHYYSGAGNASAAVDVGDGYAVVGDDESNLIRLYDLTTSGAPVKTFDFSSHLPFGTTEVDIESATRQGDVIYWEGSMSTSSSGNLAPSRSTVFATKVSGSGATTTLTYLGAYTGLLSDLIAWDNANGATLGLATSAGVGVDGHDPAALNVEGLEFASPDSSTAYLAFRAPLEPTTNRHLAMLIPVTNFAGLPTTGGPATFGAPIYFDLGGLGIRDIKENADGQFLIIAGTADDSNSGFALYEWDGKPADAPRKSGTTLPQLPSPSNLGAWETIVSVPDPLTSGVPVKLVQDDGDADFYGDGLTSKTGEQTDLQKDLGVDFAYTAPAPLPTTVAVTSSANPAAPGTKVTLTATVTGAANEAAPTGNVTFTISGSGGAMANCTGSNTVALVGSSATCVLAAGQLRAAGSAYTVTASYAGTSDYLPSVVTLQQTVTSISTSTTAGSLTLLPTSSRPMLVLAAVIPSKLAKPLLTGSATITVTNSTGNIVYTSSSTLLPIVTVTDFTIPAKTLSAGTFTVTVKYTGDEYYAQSSTHFTVKLAK